MLRLESVRMSYGAIEAVKGVSLEVRTYQPVEYERSGWPWVPGLSVLDALFHLGRDAREVLRYPHDDS